MHPLEERDFRYVVGPGDPRAWAVTGHHPCSSGCCLCCLVQGVRARSTSQMTVTQPPPPQLR